MTTELVSMPTEALAPRSMPADRHPVATYLRSIGSGSRRTMGESLELIADILTSGQFDAQTLPWGGLRYQHTSAVRAVLAERYATATANKMLSALRGVLREAWRLGYLTPADYSRAIDLKPVKGSTLPRGRCLDAGEINAIFATCCADDSPAGHRDAALLALLYGAGIPSVRSRRARHGRLQPQHGRDTHPVRQGQP